MNTQIREKNKPMVSVIMPVYNAGSYLGPAIESVLNQSFQDFEFIIVDDQSTDQSWDIINLYQRHYPDKIIATRTPHNLNKGGDSCANLALGLARGKYIARMDADDVSHFTRLEKQVDFLESHPNYFLVGSNAYVIDKNGKEIGNKLEPETYDAIYKSYFTFHPLIHPTTMYRRVIGNEHFRYQLKYSANNDYFTFFTLLCQGKKYYNLQDKLLYYRIHGKNDTFVHMKEKFLNTLKIRLTMVFKNGYKATPKQLLTTFIQGMIMFILPEKVTTQLYLIAKGIVKLHLPLIRPAIKVKTA